MTKQARGIPISKPVSDMSLGHEAGLAVFDVRLKEDEIVLILHGSAEIHRTRESLADAAY